LSARQILVSHMPKKEHNEEGVSDGTHRPNRY
jgi:hypothetical protein